MIRTTLKLIFVVALLLAVMVPSIAGSAHVDPPGVAPEPRPIDIYFSNVAQEPDPLTRRTSIGATNPAQPDSSTAPESKAEVADDVSAMSELPFDLEVAPIPPEAPAPSPARSTPPVNWSSGSLFNLAASTPDSPVRVIVPGIALDASVVPVGIDRASRDMEIPDLPNTVGWYRHGPAPLEAGTTVIAGHLDDLNGPSVFYRLGQLGPGQEIELTMASGETVSYVVRAQVRYPFDAVPASEVYRRDGPHELALLTCAGVFDRSVGRYTETLVVYAVPLN
jgi:sortase A